MSRLSDIRGYVNVWRILAVLSLIVLVAQSAWFALGLGVVAVAAIIALRRTARGKTFTDRLRLPVLAIMSAFIVGGFVLVLSDLEFYAAFGADPLGTLGTSVLRVLEAYTALIKGAFGDPARIIPAISSGDPQQLGTALRPITETLLASTPLILAGLGVAVAFRSGVFNIGAEGQLKVGATFAVLVGIWVPLPAPFHVIAAIIAGFIGGALYGFIPGILKARTGAHEVITTIMLNTIAQAVMLALLQTPILQPVGGTTPISISVQESAYLPTLVDLPRIRVHWGLILALVMAAATSWLMFRTTRGFEFRAAGLNPRAAGYAGMNAGRTIVLAMLVSGGLAGLAGAGEVLGTTHYLSPSISPGYGWDAISLALLGGTRPGGVVVAALIFGALRAGTPSMKLATDVPADLLMFVAAPRLVREIYRIRLSSAAPKTPLAAVTETPT